MKGSIVLGTGRSPQRKIVIIRIPMRHEARGLVNILLKRTTGDGRLRRLVAWVAPGANVP